MSDRLHPVHLLTHSRILVEGGLYHVFNRLARARVSFLTPRRRSSFSIFWISVNALASSRKDPETIRLHQLVATVGIERWDQRAAVLGGLLGKHPDVVSRWARTGAERRSKDVGFSDELDEFDRFLANTPSTPDNDL